MRFFIAVLILRLVDVAYQAVIPGGGAQCDDISKYSSEWFLDNVKPEWKEPAQLDNALFYTVGLSDRAREVAHSHGKVTIWQIWPCENYMPYLNYLPCGANSTLCFETNARRCLLRNADKRLIYFKNMSRAFALMTSGIVSVLHVDIWDPPLWSIWGAVERPVLEGSGRVDLIVAYDANNLSSWKTEWPLEAAMKARGGQSLAQSGFYLELRDHGEEGAQVFERDGCGVGEREHPLY